MKNKTWNRGYEAAQKEIRTQLYDTVKHITDRIQDAVLRSATFKGSYYEVTDIRQLLDEVDRIRKEYRIMSTEP